MRISYYVQRLAFTLALVIPLATLALGPQVEIFWCTAYAWGVGVGAALWHRGTVAE